MKMKEFYPEELDIRLSGRTVFRDKTLYLSHAASFVEFEFTGKQLEAELESEGGDEAFQAWIGIYADDLEHSFQRFPLEKGSKIYRLWESDTSKKVLIRIVKLSENQYAYAAIKKIKMDETALIERTKGKARRIEFIGDSITCGFGNEGKAGDSFVTQTENPLKAYAALTAGKLGCDFTLIAWSGIGVISSWIPPEREEPNTDVLAPRLYPYTDYSLYSRMGWEPNESYPYETDNCDIVVVNLGTNDASYTRQHQERKLAFREEYQRFLRYLRRTHKGKPIVCAAGSMTDLLNNEIEAAVCAVREEDNDSLIYFMMFAPQEAEDGEGAVGHPSLLRHEKMAEQLADWIRKNL